jgi:hypothetical protein
LAVSHHFHPLGENHFFGFSCLRCKPWSNVGIAVASPDLAQSSMTFGPDLYPLPLPCD